MDSSWSGGRLKDPVSGLSGTSAFRG